MEVHISNAKCFSLQVQDTSEKDAALKALEAQKEQTSKAEMEVARMRMVCQRAHEDCNQLRQENVQLRQQLQQLRYVTFIVCQQCRIEMEVVLGGFEILNWVSVFSRPKTEVLVSGLVLAMKYAKCIFI